MYCMYSTCTYIYVFIYRNVLYLYKARHVTEYWYIPTDLCTGTHIYMYHISAFTPYAGRVYAINHHLSLTIHWALCNMLTKVDNTIHFIFGLQIARIYFLIPLNLVYVYACTLLLYVNDDDMNIILAYKIYTCTCVLYNVHVPWQTSWTFEELNFQAIW